MESLRIRVELNRGRRGIPLEKLGRIAEETFKFLAMACEDAGIKGNVKDWLAVNFENNSVDFDCEKISTLEPHEFQVGRDVIRSVMANSFQDPEIRFRVRPATRQQFARIANPIDPDEVVLFGVYRNGEERPEDWFELTKERGSAVFDSAPAIIKYFGEVQGTIHAFYKGSERPKLVVRELVTEHLVDCFFKPDMYRSAVEVLMDPDAVVFVEGEITENTTKNQIESINVSDFRPAPDFDPEFYEGFLGSVPSYTGDLTTEEHIRRLRDE